jgi:hypothetical protein
MMTLNDLREFIKQMVDSGAIPAKKCFLAIVDRLTGSVRSFCYQHGITRRSGI